MPRFRKSKPLKKHSAKELALKNARSLAKMKSEVDTKWYDQSQTFTSASLHCFPETVASDSAFVLNGLLPLGVANTSAQDQYLNTSNRRIGNKVYISGIYVKLQAYWNQTLNSSIDVRYPPYAHINWAIVRQKNAVAGVEADAQDTTVPGPLDVWQNPAQTDNVLTEDPDTVLGAGEGALNDLLFQNMNNSKNYVVLKKGCIYLAGPANVNIAPAETAADDQITTFTPAGLANVEARQFGGSLVKTLSLNVHPKCQTQFFQANIGGNEQATTTGDLTFPIRNGIYFMIWTDVGGASSRFRPPAGSTFTYATPECAINCRTRFRDM